MKKVFFLILGVMMISLISSTDLAPFKQNQCGSLYQMCSNCTYVTLSGVTYPDSHLLSINQNMTKNGVDYNYSFCATTDIGDYSYSVCGDKNGHLICEVLSFAVEPYESIPVYNATLSSPSLCSNTSSLLSFSTFPYLTPNSSYYITDEVFVNNVSSDVGNFSADINGSIFNFTYDSDIGYYLSLTFLSEGNFPFTIYSTDSCIENYSGVFMSKVPYEVEICGYYQNDKSVYKNDYAYLIAEPTSSKKYYNDVLEQFLIPLGFGSTFKSSTFHAPYRNGCATLNIYEQGEYAVRIIDGVIKFDTTFSAPNITKSYGTNIYLGKYTFNKDDSIDVYFSDKDIHQYRWLFNYILIGLIVILTAISIFLFFMSSNPSFPIIFAILTIGGAIIFRIILFFVWQ